MQSPDLPSLVADLNVYRRFGIEGVEERLSFHARTDDSSTEEALAALEVLAPFAAPPNAEYDAAVDALARRHGEDARVRALFLNIADSEPVVDARLRRIEAFAFGHLDDPACVAPWVERVSWWGTRDEEIRAREILALASPADLENRRELAGLYDEAGEPERAAVEWRTVAKAEGASGVAAGRLIATLLALGRYEEAEELVERRIAEERPGAELELQAAGWLFERERYELAGRLFREVLEVESENEIALLRLGQIHSWTNDPRGAIPYLSRGLDATETRREEMEFYLAEALHSAGEEGSARPRFENVLPGLRERASEGGELEVMLAKALLRLGEWGEADPLFLDLLERHPTADGLRLDYAEGLLSAGRVERCHEVLTDVLRLDPTHARALRIRGAAQLHEDRFDEGIRSLRRAFSLRGPEAGLAGELASGLTIAGSWAAAQETYAAGLELDPSHWEYARAEQELDDRLARLFAFESRYRWVADDTIFESALVGSTLLDERTRLTAALGVGEYSGRAQAVAGGTEDVEESVAHLWASFWRRASPRWSFGAGLHAYPGAEGDLPAGLWADVDLFGRDPYWRAKARVHLNDLLAAPAAAPGLEGRTSGAEAVLFRDQGNRFWWNARLGARELSITPPSSGSVENPFYHGSFTLGRRFTRGEFKMAESVRLDRSPNLGESPFLSFEPPEGSRTLVNAWISIEALRLAGSRELASLIPIVESAEYLLLGARVDHFLRDDLGGKLETYIGADAGDWDPFFGADGGLTWRPTEGCELYAGAGFGRALARAGSEDAGHLRVGLNLRF